MIKRALISVYDKTGIVDFARSLSDMGVEILSTGGTATTIREAGVPVKDVSDFTGFPEVLDGRVKTLHPKVHAGLLYVRGHQEHEQTMLEHDLESIDLVCVNLYPFESTVARPDVTFEEAIENIDIGGPTMLRSAAKNMKHVTVVIDPDDYERVLEQLNENRGVITEQLRLELGQKVFSRVAAYNAAIAEYLADRLDTSQAPRPFFKSYAEGVPLRYGENPHQGAVFYKDPIAAEACIAYCEVLHGKEMSYNNYVDGDGALEAVKELSDVPAVAIIKHTNPCGYATGSTLSEAFEAAWAGDPVSAFGSVIAATREIGPDMLPCLENRFVEVLIAPSYDEEVLAVLKQKKKNLRLLKLHRPPSPPGRGQNIRQIHGGLLVQDRDAEVIQRWMVPTTQLFPEEKTALATFGMKACKHVKSNAIIIAREYEPGRYAVLGMGAGQPNRVDAVKKLAVTKAKENIAILYEKMKDYGKSYNTFESEIMAECVLVSDAFFPFADNVEFASEAGIRFIVQPGGSKRDEEVIAACDQFGVAMAFTGMRHFKH